MTPEPWENQLREREVETGGAEMGARTTTADRVAFISQKTWRYMSQTFKSSRRGQIEVN